MTVLPRPRVQRALGEPGTGSLVVTDAGFFPHALHHGRQRRMPQQAVIVLICVRGSGWVEAAGERTTVGPGQVVLIPPGIAHHYEADDDDPWTLWWFHVEGRLVAEWCRLAGLRSAPSVRDLDDPAEAAGLVQEILTRLRTDTTSANILAAAGVAWHLLTLLLIHRARPSSSVDAIESAAAYLREHYASAMTVAQVAARTSLSTSHFAALFRDRIGQSVHSYIVDVRMSKAREMLDLSSASIGDVAAAVGYDDPFYFSRQFRKTHGMTPTAYRSRHHR